MFFAVAQDFLFGDISRIKSTNGRTNFLILGLDQRENNKSLLTDTILFFSLDHQGKRHVLLSIPRDIWIPEMQAKLNSAYYYGNLEENDGKGWVEKFVTKITNQPIHYSILVSFRSFIKIIDLIGGVDVYVERDFVDRKYPIPGRETDPCGGDPLTRCRWETVSFKKGWTHMDGETALKFVRSRNAEGEEGTDFARAARQRKVLLAIQKKILSPKFFLDKEKTKGLLQIVSQDIQTDLELKDLGVLARLLFQTKEADVISQSIPEITPEQPGFLINPPPSQYDNQWVLVPAEGDYGRIHGWIQCLLTTPVGECERFLRSQ